MQKPLPFLPHGSKILLLLLGLVIATATGTVEVHTDRLNGNSNKLEELTKMNAVMSLKLEMMESRLKNTVTVDDLKAELQKKSLEDSRFNDMAATIAKLEERLQEKSMDESQVPIGFIYFQLPNQFSPDIIWPAVTWLEVTREYSGLFFRAEGGDSLPFGSTQDDQTRRIIQMQYTESTSTSYPNPQNITAAGWSEYGLAGVNYYPNSGHMFREALRFYTANEEVRPRNTAIRIWKRTM